MSAIRAAMQRARALTSAHRGAPPPFGWHSLRSFDAPGTRDRRTAVAIYAKLGLHPIAVHGIGADGRCTCGRGAECGGPGKHPRVAAWQRAPLDLCTLDDLFACKSRLNVGLRTGRQPCGRFLVVVDVDGARSLLEPLEREHGRFPPTLTARTGRGGLHLFYWTRDGIELGNRTGVVPNVDVRGAGGQVVAPPSRHISGAFYSWLDVREPAVLP